MERDELYALTIKAIGAAMNGDATGAADALSDLGTKGNTHAVYGACCAFAEVGKAALTKIYGDRTPDTSRGELWGMQMLSDDADPYELFAARFIVAHANGDRQQTLALFDASVAAGPHDHVCSVSQLLITAVQLSNTVLQP